jgi:hypothetical protein
MVRRSESAAEGSVYGIVWRAWRDGEIREKKGTGGVSLPASSELKTVGVCVCVMDDMIAETPGHNETKKGG